MHSTDARRMVKIAEDIRLSYAIPLLLLGTSFDLGSSADRGSERNESSGDPYASAEHRLVDGARLRESRRLI